jgi:WhiB family transcriptional regulator, redox-sensing transcriptional regulator
VVEVARLPGPVAEEWDWQMAALCRGMDPGIFFHPSNERGEKREQRENAAKKICSSCPVSAQCLQHAIKVREAYGVWGGLGERERIDLLASQGIHL